MGYSFIYFFGEVDTRIGALPVPPESLPALPAFLCAARLRETADFFSAADMLLAFAAGTHFA